MVFERRFALYRSLACGVAALLLASGVCEVGAAVPTAVMAVSATVMDGGCLVTRRETAMVRPADVAVACTGGVPYVVSVETLDGWPVVKIVY